MKKTTIAIVLLASLNNISGQGNQSQYNPSAKNVPTSPEVALLGRFGDIPIGHYTGTAEVSVPLYNLKVDNIDIPLALSYHTSGIKVADEATWVGLGWNFMPEGTITQEIRGREDNPYGGDGFNTLSGYNAFKSNFTTLNSENPYYRLSMGWQQTNDGLSFISPQPTDDAYDVIIALKAKKGQPDIFTYNFYGYSGKFFYNPENNNEILFLESNQDVKFVRNFDGWLATTNKGDKFFFYVVEKSRTNQTDYTDIGITFKVSKIQLASGKIINFTYLDESTYQEYPAEVARFPSFGQNQSVTTNYNATINNKKTLIGIETEDTQINFNLDNRDDIKPYSASIPVKKLASIDIKSKYPNRKIKSFLFNTSYFPTVSFSGVEEGYKNKRLKLNSIQEVNYNEAGTAVQNIPPYAFEYNTTFIMPSKLSSSDFYGYYNGSNGGTLLPDLTFFDYLNTPPYKNYGLNVNYPYNGANRYTNSDYAVTNILNKISYPTGARTEFEYESNTFTNQFIPTAQQVASANKDVSVTHRGASTVPGGYYFLKSQPFKLTKEMKINFSNTIFDGYMGPNYPQTHYDYYQMLNCNIVLHKTKTVNGQYVDTILKEWKIDVAGSVFEQTHQQKWDEDFIVPLDTDPSTEYYVYVSNGIQYNSNDGIHFAVVSSHFKYYDDSGIDKSISYGSGVRVKSIKNYENNTLLSHKTYTYSGGKLIYKFEPIGLIREATYKSQPTVQNGGCYTEYISIFNDLSVNSSDFGISGNKPFGYSEVTEKDVDVFNGTYKGFTKYGFSNTESQDSFIAFKGIPKREIPSNGENVYIEKYDQNQNKVFNQTNFYSNLPNTYGIYPQFYITDTSTGIYDPSYASYPIVLQGCGSGNNWVIGTSYTGSTFSNSSPVSKYRFVFNPLITGKRRLMRTIDTSYLNGNSMVEKREMSYTASGDLDISTTTTSEGKIVTTDYDYAYDVNNTRLVNKGMTGIPLDVETTSGSKTLSHTETKYDNLNNYLPSSVISYNLQTNSLDTEVTYNKYDAKGNLLEYTTKDGIPVALIWGYNNTKPIAKIEGITYDSAMALAGASEIVSKSNEDVDTATQDQLIDKLDLFRKNNVILFITTYTYDPLIGVTSITPPSGIREVYLYDSANRLKEIRENSQTGNILKEFKYNYKN
ncbi:hypothetical protein H9Q08_01275 [Chryseobacterium sp. PS-8]|uniref:YD repeat-containing protein n=1 Tax=Chryseobacterium indicum TaxID=2766954 RepID=A0ABS9C2F4_9FLAO|nr:hypothetical protein [Chryseobacterium sp. PS-8]MCF2217932.1 hypothetical protein [Chryseobacterium sp. PS-8]